MNKFFKLFVFLLVLIAMNIIYQKNAEAHKAHSHGVATLDISLEKDELELNFHIPGADALGFEHKPKTAEEKSKLQSVMKMMKESLALVSTPTGCTEKKRKVEDEFKKDHAELEMEVEFKCTDITTIKSLDITLFKAFPSLSKVDVTLVTTTGTTPTEVTPSKTNIEIK